MWVHVCSRQLQKGGNAPAEYEDAFFPRGNFQLEAHTFRVCVADGATETSYSGEWAQTLAWGYGRGRIAAGRLPQTLTPLQRRWQMAVGSQPLPWYATEKLQLGAFSTLLGVTIRDEGRRWEATAAGDSCLFQVRDGRSIGSFPLTDSESFSSHPALLSSLPARLHDMDSVVAQTSGEWWPGDAFLLATDALAQWLMKGDEAEAYTETPLALQRIPRRGRKPATIKQAAHARPNPMSELARAMRSQDEFEGWVSQLRAGGGIRNDDVTVMAVQVSEHKQ
jgi:hypothetical protein